MYNYKKYIFNNGLRLIAVPMKGTKTVTVLVVVGTGSKYETKKINGISHFVEHMMFKGTKKRPTTKDIAEDLDRVGGEFNAFTDKEYTGYYAKVDAIHFDLAMDVISDILLNSKFQEKEIAKEKRVIIEEINMYHDAPMQYVQELFEKLLYKDQPAGWHIIGEKDSVLSLKRQNFLAYLNDHYRSSNITVCIAGNVETNAVKNKINKYFAKILIGRGKDKLTTKERQTKPQTLLHFKNTDQTHFCLGVRSYNLFHPFKFAQDILATILGGNMSSRLFLEVREKRGLTYYIHTGVNELTDTGYLVTRAGVDNKRAEEAMTTILNEYKKIKRKGIASGELKKAKDFLRGKMALSLESSDEIAGFVAGQEILKRKIETPDEIMAQINKVTVGDIQKVAQDIFQSEKLNLALIGPFRNKKQFEKLLVL